MLAVIQKSNQVSSLQGQLIATQDRSLRAERRSDELEAPNRDAQSAGAATESGITGCSWLWSKGNRRALQPRASSGSLGLPICES